MIRAITRELPSTVGTFVDVMGGAFNVGANIVATDMVYYNEIDSRIFEIVNWLIQENKADIVAEVEKCIAEYGLGKGLEKPYRILRDAYNQTGGYIELFLLHMYAFQNLIRFNGNQKFNTPIGVAGYSDDMKRRIENFIPKTKRVVMSNRDYVNMDWTSFPKDSVFYFDPPYYITSAAYNDGKRGGKGWSIKEELELLDILLKLNENGYKFMLSNVVEHKGKQHEILLNWVKEHGFIMAEAGVSGWRYAKNEVIIKNYMR